MPVSIRFRPGVIYHMTFTSVLLHENLVTLVALVWSLPIVNHHMTFKIAHILYIDMDSKIIIIWESLLFEKLMSHRMHKYGLPPVSIHLWPLKWQLYEKHLITKTALIWSLPSMNHHMNAKTFIIYGSPHSLIAIIWY